MLLQNNFDGGTSGDTVTAGNSGGSSGDAFGTPVIAATHTLTYDNSVSHSGGNSLKVAAGGTAGLTYVPWSFTAAAEIWFRFYYRQSANTAYPMLSLYGGGSERAKVMLFQPVSPGKVRTVDATGSTVKDSPLDSTLNQWIRVEGRVLGHASTGRIDAYVYNAADSRWPDEQLISANLNSGGTIDAVRFGFGATSFTNQTLWLDDIAVSDTGPLGPTAGATPSYQTLNQKAMRLR